MLLPGGTYQLVTRDFGNANLFRMHLEPGESLLVALIDQSDDDFAITIMTDDAKVLTSGQSGEWPYYYARYAADKRIDLIVKISSSADWATYSASFAWR